jgi:hypothetical protein
VLAQNPFTVLCMRQKAKDELVWGDLEFALEFAPPLNADWLDDIRDGKPIPNLSGKAPDTIAKHDVAMYKAYNQALIYAFQLPADVFKKTAKEKDFEYLKFGHLYTEAREHRGKIVMVKGRLVRIRKHEAPPLARIEGIKHVYEGWVFGETKYANPYLIIFPILPDGFQVTETMNRPVTFYGYFLGKIKVRVEKGDIYTPVLIGPTIYPDTTAPQVAADDDETPFPLVALIGIVAILVAVVALMCFLSWWFRRGDSAILAALQDQRTTRLLENGDPWNDATEANEPSHQGFTSQPPDDTQRLP